MNIDNEAVSIIAAIIRAQIDADLKAYHDSSTPHEDHEFLKGAITGVATLAEHLVDEVFGLAPGFDATSFYQAAGVNDYIDFDVPNA